MSQTSLFIPATKDEEYERLLSEDRPLFVLSPPRTSWWRKTIYTLLICTVSLMLTMPVMLLVTPRLILKERHPFTFTDCGNTSTSAREAGCGHEPMMRAWVPPECYYKDIIDDYDQFHDRKWFADKKMTIPSNISRLESGDEELAYTRYWHDEHCTYIFRKLAVAIEKRYPAVTNTMANIDHSHHCASMVALRLRNFYNETYVHIDDTFTESHLNFQTCVPMHWA